MSHGTCPQCDNPIHFAKGHHGDLYEPPSAEFWYCDHCDWSDVTDPIERLVCIAESKWDDDHGH